MKLHPEDPRITSFLLGELSDQDAEIVAAAIRDDPALQAACAEIESLRDTMRTTLERPRETLDESRREQILAAAREADRENRSLPIIRLRRVVLPAAAAAVVAIAAWFAWNRAHETSPRSAADAATDASETPARPSAPADPVAFPAIAGLAEFRNPSGSPMLDLPVIGRTSGLQPIARSIREDHLMPQPAAVRVSSLLNSFPLHPEGATVVTRFPVNHWHPDNRSPTVTTHAATVATEVMACPWKPSALLLFVSFGGNSNVDCELRASFHASPSEVRRYRLLENPTPDPATAPAPTSRLHAGNSSLLAIEIEPAGTATDLGSIVWSVNGRPATTVPVTFDPSREPSDDARFGALLCSFAMWAGKNPDRNVDDEVVAALAREIAAENLPVERADFLILVDQSLNL